MPLYEYECVQEDRRFELIQKFSDAPLTQCPECGGEVRKVLSAPAVHFKGAGWYVTDYGKNGQKPKQDADSKGETKADSKSDAKSEKKDSKKTESVSASKD